MWLPSSTIVPIIPERVPFSSASVFTRIVCIPSFPTYAVPANVLPSLSISCGAFLGSVYITFALYPKSLYASSRAFPISCWSLAPFSLSPAIFSSVSESLVSLSCPKKFLLSSPLSFPVLPCLYHSCSL